MMLELLDFLAKENNLLLQHIPRKENYPALLHTIETMDGQIYSIEQWNRALSYLFQAEMEFETPDDAWDFCIDELKRRIQK